jgi:hypothetical protein
VPRKRDIRRKLRNRYARDVRSPKYRPRVVPDKKREERNRWRDDDIY